MRKVKRMLSASHLFLRRSLCSVRSHIELNADIIIVRNIVQYAIALNSKLW